VNALTDSDSWQGAFKEAAMSSSLLLSEFAVKTLARCSANRIDFSMVEWAQLPSGFHRGGIVAIDLFKFFCYLPYRMVACRKFCDGMIECFVFPPSDGRL
jgi:hypothetical protein